MHTALSGQQDFCKTSEQVAKLQEKLMITVSRIVGRAFGALAFCLAPIGQIAAQGASNVHTVTLVDDDPVPVVSFGASAQSVAEGNSGSTSVTATINLSAVSGRNVSVPYTVSGTADNPGDHNAASGSVSITAGQTSGAITFSVFGDTLGESNDTVILTLGAPANATKVAPDVHTVTIVNDEPAGSDTTPNQFTFVDKTNVLRSALQTSNEITIAGIDTGVNVTVVGGTYSKNGGAFTSTAGTAVAGDRFRVQHTSSPYFEDTRSTTLTVGGVSDTFSSTTKVSPEDECNPICP
jgi:hypothetical protein